MSYLAPVVITSQVQSTVWTGVILACSSLTGMIVDFMFAKMFVSKRHQFFLRILLSLTLFFPFSLLAWQFVPSLLFGMVVWGVYFEAIVFSNHRAVQEYLPAEEHVRGWGMITLLRTVSLVIGPFLASYYGGGTMRVPLIIAAVLFGTAIAVFAVSRRLLPIYAKVAYQAVVPVHTLTQEFRVWGAFARPLWPLLGLVIVYYLIESAYFNIGPLYGEALKQSSPFGSIFVSLFCLPGLAAGLLAPRLARPFGKKFITYLGGLIGGFGLIMMSWQSEVHSILLWNLVGASGIGMVFPELMATFENYVSRVHRLGNDLIGLTAICGSLAYVVGPITNGFLYQIWGAPATFRLWGTVLMVYCILLLLIVPRKVKMPRHDLESVVSNPG